MMLYVTRVRGVKRQYSSFCNSYFTHFEKSKWYIAVNKVSSERNHISCNHRVVWYLTRQFVHTYFRVTNTESLAFELYEFKV